MKEIKFRAWSKTDNEMFAVDLIVFNDKTTKDKAHILDERNDVHYLEDIELMQYTGVKDKNNIEVFEGDIVRNTLNDTVGVVEMVGGCFCIMVNGERFVFKDEKQNNTLIIGNKYENEELLEGI